MFYIVSESDKYGDLAVIFNPDKRTLYNMIGGFAPAVRAKYNELYEQVTPSDAEKDDDND